MTPASLSSTCRTQGLQNVPHQAHPGAADPKSISSQYPECSPVFSFTSTLEPFLWHSGPGEIINSVFPKWTWHLHRETEPSSATALRPENNMPSRNSLLCPWVLNPGQLGEIREGSHSWLSAVAFWNVCLAGKTEFHSGSPDTGTAPRELPKGWA